MNPEASKSERPRMACASVLIAISGAIFVEGLRSLLPQVGAKRILVAKDPREAANLGCQEPVDLALIDFTFNGIPQIDLIKTIRGCAPRAKIIVILESVSEATTRMLKRVAPFHICRMDSCLRRRYR